MSVSLDMARASAADGISTVACTSHILPGVYDNSGPQIRTATEQLQRAIDQAGIALRLTTGADNHIVPGFLAGLQSGRLLSLADSRYVPRWGRRRGTSAANRCSRAQLLQPPTAIKVAIGIMRVPSRVRPDGVIYLLRKSLKAVQKGNRRYLNTNSCLRSRKRWLTRHQSSQLLNKRGTTTTALHCAGSGGFLHRILRLLLDGVRA